MYSIYPKKEQFTLHGAMKGIPLYNVPFDYLDSIANTILNDDPIRKDPKHRKSLAYIDFVKSNFENLSNNKLKVPCRIILLKSWRTD